MKRGRQSTVVHLVHSLSGGGTERTLLALLQRLPQGEIQHVVVTQRDAGELAARLPDDVACRAMGAGGRSWVNGLRLGGILRKLRADVIHARNTGCWMDAVVAGAMHPRVRLVLGFHGLENKGGFDPRMRWSARAGALLGARFTSVSAAGREKLARECGILPDRVTVLHNGVDLTRFAPADASRREAVREQLGFGAGDVVFGTVGSLSPVKRHDLLIEAFAGVSAEVAAARLVIVGEGPCRARLEELVRQRGLGTCVSVAGASEGVAQWLTAMDVYVCSSDSEGVSNAMLEALASGLPVLTTDVGDHAAIVRSGVEGVAVAPGQAGKMTEAMLRLARDAGLRRSLGASARQRALAFSIEGMMEHYQEFYGWLIESSTRTPRAAVYPLVSCPGSAQAIL